MQTKFDLMRTDQKLISNVTDIRILKLTTTRKNMINVMCSNRCQGDHRCFSYNIRSSATEDICELLSAFSYEGIYVNAAGYTHYDKSLSNMLT